MRGSLTRSFLLPILILCVQLNLFAQIDSIQRLVDSDISSEKYQGFIGLAEYHFQKKDSLSLYILSRANLEDAGLDDSLYRSLTIRKVELINRIFSHQEGVDCLRRALIYSSKRKDSISMAKWYELSARHYFYLYKYDSAQMVLEKGIELLNTIGLEDQKANLILRLATVDYATGNYERAITRAFEATEIFKINNQEKQLGIAYLQLGNIHYFLKDYEDALTYYDLSAIHFKKTEDIYGYHNALSNIGLVHIEKGNYIKGIQLQHKSLKHYRQEKRFFEAGNTYYYLGKAHSGLRNFDSSDYYMNFSIEVNKRSKYPVGISYANWIKSTNQMGRNRIDSAYYYNQKAFDELGEVKDFELMKLLHKQGSDVEEQRGNYKESLYHLQTSLSLEDSLNIDYEFLDQVARNQRAKLENAEYELKMAKARAKKQEEENQKQQQLIVAISVIASLLVFFVIGLVLTNRRNKSLHKQLLENKDTIEQELDTKKALLKEIHHRVKNNLQIISSMLSIQAQYIEDERLDEIINECRSRIVSMSLIHESLYKKEDEEKSLFSNYIRQLLPQLIDTYHIDKSKVDLEMGIDEFELSLDDSVPCGLMINEIISNSLKHAFPNGQNGKIEIKMKKKGKEVILRISDNGIGLPEKFEPEDQDSFGFLLIYTLAHQLEANIKVENNEGVYFEIRWDTKDDKLLN